VAAIVDTSVLAVPVIRSVLIRIVVAHLQAVKSIVIVMTLFFVMAEKNVSMVFVNVPVHHVVLSGPSVMKSMTLVDVFLGSMNVRHAIFTVIVRAMVFFVMAMKFV
jgi:hypothetical protein